MKITEKILATSLLLLAISFSGVQAQYLEEFEEKVTEFTLDNGLTFVVIERPVAPVVSFATYVNVGGANNPLGNSGLAHVFEHMAFKGTHDVGTSNWKKEKKVLQKLDATYQKWLEEKHSINPDSTRINELWSEFEALQEEAGQYVVNNEFSEIVNRNGGTGMNATTSADRTNYFYSLPENRIELWFSLESDRFLNPVFREFYKEKEVVREERRSSYESSPVGKLYEAFLTTAYKAHPYGTPNIGWHSDITATTMEDAREFYETYYVPNNITIAIAGDVDPNEVRKLAKTYFGRLKKGPTPPPIYTEEPEQIAEKRFTIEQQSQPFLLLGYHTVNDQHPDHNALNLLSNILVGGRTSKLYKRLVEKEQVALGFQNLNGVPGTKYESMFALLAVPNRGYDTDTLETAIYEELEKIKNGEITQEELDRVRTNARAGLIRGLDSNSGLAVRLGQAQSLQGDWRKVFTNLEDLEAVTIEDIQRVAKKYLVKENLTVGSIVNAPAGEVADANQ
ncbi:MAG: insulinase family protein [Gracilimonas sp.]|uniref:M16 family metallopeptidase n=1 Tax=Gracilimonas TaxID=649462 RepID=UPI001B07F20E|nr:pitrilysin family protein [Gracilimonas sp.]MBO6585715.1 insulinase family protein [Gracilimonas sp.]MBO6616712.1 insulinase family protein [Gracilimonas sp.]